MELLNKVKIKYLHELSLNSQSRWRVVLLHDNNVVRHEIKKVNKYKCYLIGIIWKYMPDLTFKKRDYIIVDA